MRVLVFGGTGYLGTELVRRSAWGVGSADGDVRDEEAVLALIRRHGPRVVINAAYKQEGEDAWSINVEGARTIARAAALTEVELIHMSTDVVFSGAKGGYRERDEPDPLTEYGASKAEAERAVRASNRRSLIVRTSLIYGGPGYPASKHERLARDAAAGTADVTFFTDELRSPIQVGDLAAALLELAERAHEHRGSIWHVAGADGVSRCEFARLVAGDAVCCAPVPDGVVRPRDCTLNSSVAAALLQTRLRGCREVLAVSS